MKGERLMGTFFKKLLTTLSLREPFGSDLKDSSEPLHSPENQIRNEIIRLKGKSLLDFPSNFTVIDIETTGLMPTYSKIIEIGAVKVRNWEIVDTFQALIYPILDYDSYNEEIINDYEDDDIYDEDDYEDDDECPDELLNDLENYIPYKIEEMTGLTIYDLITKGEKIDKVLEDFHNFIDANEIIMAHNANFDINFIYDNLLSIHNKHFNNDYIDTLRLSRQIFPELERHKLPILMNFFDLDYQVHHRSIDDCLSCFAIYKKCYQNILERYQDVEVWKQSLRYKKPSEQMTAPTDETINKNSTFYDKLCVFTGDLSLFENKKTAMQQVVNLGGTVKDNITKKTDFLIIGTDTYQNYLNGEQTGKIKKAFEFNNKGSNIKFLSENEFNDVLIKENKVNTKNQ